MTQSDQIKVINAGFTIIRADEHNLLIKMRNKDHLRWVVLHNGFKSKAALKRKMDELLKLNLVIED